jgi:Mn2+/Fe2+ NRAMP family transporter
MLLYIDFLFHLPLEIAGVVLAYCAFSIFMSWRSGKLAEAVRAENDDIQPETAR